MYALLSFLSVLVASVALAQPTGPPTGPANCANATTLFCLAGRNTTTNDAIISKTGAAGGTLTGSLIAGAPLNLRASSSTTNPGSVVIGNHITGIVTPFRAVTTDYNGLTLGAGTATNVSDFVAGGDGTDTITMGGHDSHRHFGFVDSRVYTQASGIAGESSSTISFPDLVNWTSFDARGTINSNTGSVFNFTNLAAFRDITTFLANGGTLNHIDSYRSYSSVPTMSTFGHAGEVTSFYSALSYNGTSTIIGRGLLVSSGSWDAGASIRGIELAIDTDNASNRSFYSSGAAPSVHASSLTIGSTSITSGSIGLEVNSTTMALLPSRMTTTQRDALTAVNGMIIYNSTTNAHQVYQSGAWTDLSVGGGIGAAVLLAGRTITGNDFTISTSGPQGGSIIGSTVDEAPFHLDSGNDDFAGPIVIGTRRNTFDSDQQRYSTMLNFDLDDVTVLNPVSNTPSAHGHHIITVGATVDGVGGTVTSQDTNIATGSEYYTNVLSDHRRFLQPDSSGGFSSGIPPGGSSEMDEYFLARSEVEIHGSNGSNFNIRKLRPFVDNTEVSAVGTGTVQTITDWVSFHAGIAVSTPIVQAATYYALKVVPSLVTNSAIHVIGANVTEDTDAFDTIAFQSNVSNTDSGSRFLSGTGTAPSVIVGPTRMGSNAVATQQLEVLGNILVDNSGTAGTMRVREASAGGSNYSSLTFGILSGSDATSVDTLKLRGNDGTSRGAATYSEIVAGDQVTSLATNVSPYSIFEWGGAPTWSTNASIVNTFNTGEHRIWTIGVSQSSIGGVRGFVYAPRVQSDIDFTGGGTSDMGWYSGLFYVPTFEATTAKTAWIGVVNAVYDAANTCDNRSFSCVSNGADTVTIDTWYSHWLNGGPGVNGTVTRMVGFLNTANNTTGTITELNGHEDAPTVGSGRTLATRRGLYYKNRGSTGTVTTSYGVHIADQTVGTTAAGMFSEMIAGTGKWHLYLTGTAKSLFGGAIVGSEAADGNLTLQSTTNADMGTIVLADVPFDDSEVALQWAPTFGDNTGFGTKTPVMVNFAPIVTNDQVIGSSPIGYQCSGSVTNTASSVSAPTCVVAAWTMASSSGALPIPRTFRSAPTYAQSAAATTSNPITDVVLTPTFSTTPSGTISSTVTEANGISWTPVVSAASTNTQTVTDLSAMRVVNATKAGAGGTEIITQQNGIWINALTSGTNNFPIRLTEAAASTTGTVPASAAIITATTGSPSRITIVNENQQRFDVGYATWTGSTGTALAGDNTTRFFPVNDVAGTAAADGAGTTEGNFDIAAPGALTVVYMACGLDVDVTAGASTQTRTFTLMEDTVASAVSCTMTEAVNGTNCTWCQTGTTGCTATGTAELIDAGDMIDIRSTAANTPAASKATCTIWYTLNAF